MTPSEVRHFADYTSPDGGITGARLVAPERPAPPYDPAPDGYHYEITDDFPHWKYDPDSGRICRQMKCKNPGLYGRWIEDGKLCRWELVADE